MKQVILTRGKVALVDDCDYERVNKHRWLAQLSRGRWYARRTTMVRLPDGRRQAKVTFLHQVVLRAMGKAPKGKPLGDHISGDSLDCRRSNLRWASTQDNACNRGPARNSQSGIKGVYPRYNKFHASCRRNGKLHYLGTFDTAREAHEAYLKKAQELHGEFARA
jgi:hypothetical protein